MFKLWRVILERGPKDPVQYGPESERRAYYRAQSLSELHGCTSTRDDIARTVTVHGGDWYRGQS